MGAAEDAHPPGIPLAAGQEDPTVESVAALEDEIEYTGHCGELPETADVGRRNVVFTYRENFSPSSRLLLVRDPSWEIHVTWHDEERLRNQVVLVDVVRRCDAEVNAGMTPTDVDNLAILWDVDEDWFRFPFVVERNFDNAGLHGVDPFCWWFWFGFWFWVDDIKRVTSIGAFLQGHSGDLRRAAIVTHRAPQLFELVNSECHWSWFGVNLSEEMFS